MEEIEGFRTGKSDPPRDLFFRGSACLKFGRLKEAEEALRRSLAIERIPELRTISRDRLGRVLMEQERWDKAEALFPPSMIAHATR
ncbi:MAG TPA: hypothetical protein VKX45_12880 [Bryobacteraceae bacterium]|nr:hypothetical protein [Bryobacteraceae bacterium]